MPEKARADGFDWFIIQDADEFYSEASWKKIKNILQNNKTDDHFTTTWYNFWKSSRFVLVNMNGSMKGTNAGFAVRCSSKLKFADRRICDTNITRVIDCPCYHYSYVMSDQEMREKIATWSHAHQVFSTSWFKYKWLNWTESTRWLNPVFPIADERAISFPLEQPDFAEQFAMPINKLGGEIPKFSMLGRGRNIRCQSWNVSRPKIR